MKTINKYELVRERINKRKPKQKGITQTRGRKTHKRKTKRMQCSLIPWLLGVQRRGKKERGFMAELQQPKSKNRASSFVA